MLAYSLRDLIQLFLVLLLISFLVFMLIHIVPGDPVAALMGVGNSDPGAEGDLVEMLEADVRLEAYYFIAPLTRWNDPAIASLRKWLIKHFGDLKTP
jgi:ABC-type dipeptide/oligopeptide/nickel transport system permease component